MSRGQGPHALACRVGGDCQRQHGGLRRQWFLHIARYMCWRQLCEKGRYKCPGAPPTPCAKWSFRLIQRWVSVSRERLERAKRQAEQAWTTFSVAETRLVAARAARNASGREWMVCVDGGEGAERDTRDGASVSGGEAWRTTTQEQPVRSDAQRD